MLMSINGHITFAAAQDILISCQKNKIMIYLRDIVSPTGHGVTSLVGSFFKVFSCLLHVRQIDDKSLSRERLR